MKGNKMVLNQKYLFNWMIACMGLFWLVSAMPHDSSYQEIMQSIQNHVVAEENIRNNVNRLREAIESDTSISARYRNWVVSYLKRVLSLQQHGNRYIGKLRWSEWPALMNSIIKNSNNKELVLINKTPYKMVIEVRDIHNNFIVLRDSHNRIHNNIMIHKKSSTSIRIPQEAAFLIVRYQEPQYGFPLRRFNTIALDPSQNYVITSEKKGAEVVQQVENEEALPGANYRYITAYPAVDEKSESVRLASGPYA